jgi:transcriptional regulator with XRE-family HTH domain
LCFVKRVWNNFTRIFWRLENSQGGIKMLLMVEESMGDRLKRLREARGLTKYRLSKIAAISETYIYHLESGHIANPRRDTLIALAKGLGVPLSEIAGEPSAAPHETWELVETSLKAYVPVYVEVSAGEGMEPIDWVACTRAKAAPDSLRAYRVKGLCLEPEIREGDTLIVDTELQPEPGNLVVVIIDGQASVKKYREAYSGTGGFIREDKASYKWVENNDGKYQPEDIHLHGVVTEINRKVR